MINFPRIERPSPFLPSLGTSGKATTTALRGTPRKPFTNRLYSDAKATSDATFLHEINGDIASGLLSLAYVIESLRTIRPNDSEGFINTLTALDQNRQLTRRLRR